MKNCPFCGSSHIEVSSRTTHGHGDCSCEVFVVCEDCHAHGPDTGYYGEPTVEQKEKAILLWNKRDLTT